MTNQKTLTPPASSASYDHKAWLRAYFNGIGYERWAAIYGQGKVSSVRRSVREGHRMMLDRAGVWLDAQTFPAHACALDAGCGTGLFSIALAQRGFRVTAVDISTQMTSAAQSQARQVGVAEWITFITGDLEAVNGTYDVVSCFDVLIHYAPPDFTRMCTRLAHLCRGTLLLTYAPYNRLLATMHWIGGHFPRSQRRTDIQMIRDTTVQQILESAGMHIQHRVRVSKGFYHVTLVEARRAHP